jgi:hypothetical protein
VEPGPGPARARRAERRAGREPGVRPKLRPMRRSCPPGRRRPGNRRHTAAAGPAGVAICEAARAPVRPARGERGRWGGRRGGGCGGGAPRGPVRLGLKLPCARRNQVQVPCVTRMQASAGTPTCLRRDSESESAVGGPPLPGHGPSIPPSIPPSHVISAVPLDRLGWTGSLRPPD